MHGVAAIVFGQGLEGGEHTRDSMNLGETAAERHCLVVEDQRSTRVWLCNVVQQPFPDLNVVPCGSVKAARQHLQQWQATQALGLALVDIGLPDGSGIELIRQISEQFHDAIVVVATIYDDDAHLFDAIAAGAKGYLLKDELPEILIDYLRRIENGEPPLSPSIAHSIMEHFRGAAQGSGDKGRGSQGSRDRHQPDGARGGGADPDGAGPDGAGGGRAAGTHREHGRQLHQDHLPQVQYLVSRRGDAGSGQAQPRVMRGVLPSSARRPLVPGNLLVCAMLVALAMAATVTFLATDQYWLGLRLAFDEQAGGAVVKAATALRRGTVITSVESATEKIVLTARDFVAEPAGAIPTYRKHYDFLARQGALSRIVDAPEVTLTDKTGKPWRIVPRGSRPLFSLSVEYWVQIAVGAFA